jgi:hypothetical protein
MNFLSFIAGVVIGGIVMAAFASVLWGIQERKLMAERDVLETENGILRQAANARTQASAQLGQYVPLASENAAPASMGPRRGLGSHGLKGGQL